MSVQAVLVGIESYDCRADGINLELDGPASDAVRFANWMLRRGVPSGNIHLFMNALDLPQRQQELSAPVLIHPPNRDAMDQFFDNELPQLKGNTLYVLWGGHGVMRHGQERHLFYGNIRANSPFTFNLESRLAQLRTRSQFTEQHVFVDACANYVELTQFSGLSPTQVVQSAKPGFVTQHVLCAAAAGEKALNDPIRRTGLFSDVLLEQFEASVNFPSAEEIAPRVDAIFTKRKETDKRYRHAPISLKFQAESGAGFEHGWLPRVLKLQALSLLCKCPVAALEALGKALLDTAVGTNSQLRDACYAAVKPSAQRFSDTGDDCVALGVWTLAHDKRDPLKQVLIGAGSTDAGAVDDLFRRAKLVTVAVEIFERSSLPSHKYARLYRRVDSTAAAATTVEEMLTNFAFQGPASSGKVYRFLLEAAELVEPDLRPEIDSLVRSQASAQTIANLRDEIAAGRKYRLLLVFKEKVAWGLRLRNGVEEKHIAKAINADPHGVLESLYDELLPAEDDIREEQVESVELLLNPPELALQLENAGFPGSGSPLSHQFPVFLRYYSRLRDPLRNHGRMWTAAAQGIRSLAKSPVRRLSIDCGQCDWGTIDLHSAHLVDFAYLASPLQSLAEALKRGMAYSCWLRTPMAAGYAPAIDQFAQTLTDYSELPRKLPDARMSKRDFESLALFWDDPETNPLEYIKVLKEPQ